jgi:Conjugative transposon protein TcpC
MAAGIRVLPGPPALQPMTADQATSAMQEPTGPEVVAQTPHGGWDARAAETADGTSAHVRAPVSRAPARSWSGAGGRWLIWAFRVVLWTALLLIGFRGVTAIVAGQPVTGSPAPKAHAAARAFPVSLARAFALAFGQAYLNYSAATAAHRAAELATFLPPGADPQLGWNGSGAQALQFEQVAGVKVTDRHRAVVTLLARAGGHLIEVAVPIYATSAGMVVAGRPALLPPPSNVALPTSAFATSDPVAKSALKRMLPGFFRAYATGDPLRLAAFSPHGTVITGLGSVVVFAGLVKLVVPAAAGQVRHVIATVSWRSAAGPVSPPGSASSSASPSAGSTSPAAGSASQPGAPRAAVQMSYALTLVRHGGGWLVLSIGPAAAQPWPSS